MWKATVRIRPKDDMIVPIATNAGGKAANAAAQDIGEALEDRLEPSDRRERE
jgi:hypothetical protein